MLAQMPLILDASMSNGEIVHEHVLLVSVDRSTIYLTNKLQNHERNKYIFSFEPRYSQTNGNTDLGLIF